jgi:hypothetical protein
MADNILLPIVQVMQHPGVPICPVVVIPTKVGVDNHMVAQTGSKLSHGEEECLLQVNRVIGVTSEDGDLCSHPLHQRSQAKVGLELAQLALVEVCHFKCLDVVEIGKV